MADENRAKECLAERREYFRITDVLPLAVKRIESMVGKKSRVLSQSSPSFMSGAVFDDLTDGIVNPKLARLLCEMNAKLDRILDRLSGICEEPASAEPQEVSLSASGVSFDTPDEFCPGDLLEIKILLPLHPPTWIVLYGSVSRAEPEGNGLYKVGVYFAEIEEDARDLLSYYTIKRQREIIMKQRRSEM